MIAKKLIQILCAKSKINEKYACLSITECLGTQSDQPSRQTEHSLFVHARHCRYRSPHGAVCSGSLKI